MATRKPKTDAPRTPRAGKGAASPTKFLPASTRSAPKTPDDVPADTQAEAVAAQIEAHRAARVARHFDFIPPRLRPGELDDILERMKFYEMDGGPKISQIEASQDELEKLSAEQTWVRLSGETPLEFLVRVYRNPWKPDMVRNNAAVAVLSFVHKQRARVIDPGDGQPLIPGVMRLAHMGPVDVRRLSTEDLEVLDAIIARARVTEPPNHEE